MNGLGAIQRSRPMKACLRNGDGHIGIYFIKDDMTIPELARITGHPPKRFVEMTTIIDLDYRFCTKLFRIFNCDNYHYLSLDEYD